MKRTAIAGIAGLAAALLLSGCGASGTPSAQADPNATLVAAIGGEPDKLDPQSTTSYFAFEVLENVFDTLVEPDQNLDMQPALAESWTVSDDQLTWTFTLRKGVKFQDGSDFTSADVVYSYRRIIDDKLANAWRLTAITDISAPDANTVVIKVGQPTPNLLSSLGGFKGMAIVSKANVDAKKINTAPVGTGPFSVAEYVSGDHITLDANPNYWGGAPKVAKVEFRFISESATALAALRSGDIQWTDVVPTQQVSTLQSDASVKLGLAPSNDYWYLALNEARKPWSDVRVRQAIAYAIDRDAIVQAVSYGTAVKNQLAIPKTSKWYTEYAPFSTDLDKAKSLMAEAGYTGGTLDLLATKDYPQTVTAAEIIAANLKPLGIEVSIRKPDFSTWLDDEGKGNFDMFMLGWLGNIDPDDFYYAQHHSKGVNNFQKFSNAEVDKLLDAGRVETDPAKRKDLYAQAAKIIADEVSYAYLYNPAVIQVWSPSLQDYTTRSDRAIRFRTAYLTK